jgi:hypothetical protein
MDGCDEQRGGNTRQSGWRITVADFSAAVVGLHAQAAQIVDTGEDSKIATVVRYRLAGTGVVCKGGRKGTARRAGLTPVAASSNYQLPS